MTCSTIGSPTLEMVRKVQYVQASSFMTVADRLSPHPPVVSV